MIYSCFYFIISLSCLCIIKYELLTSFRILVHTLHLTGPIQVFAVNFSHYDIVS